MKVKKMKVAKRKEAGLDSFPNFSASGSVRGMKEMYYGRNALLIRCGSYIYNVTRSPDIYAMAND